jgi:hypothetical protein
MTKREWRNVRNVLLWSVATWAVLGVGVYRLAEPMFHPTKDEAREHGERIVAALEEYKATHGFYPPTLQQTGLPKMKSGVCYYHEGDEHGDWYDLFVYSAWGADQWWYRSKEAEWSYSVSSGG